MATNSDDDYVWQRDPDGSFRKYLLKAIADHPPPKRAMVGLAIKRKTAEVEPQYPLWPGGPVGWTNAAGKKVLGVMFYADEILAALPKKKE